MSTYEGTIVLGRDIPPNKFDQLVELAAYLDQNHFATTLWSSDNTVFLDYSIETSLIEDLNLVSDDVRCWVWETVARALIDRLGEHHADNQGPA